MKKTIYIEIGALYRKTIRNFLDRCKFEELNIKYMETKGLIVSQFAIKGNEKDLKFIKDKLEAWQKDL